MFEAGRSTTERHESEQIVHKGVRYDYYGKSNIEGTRYKCLQYPGVYLVASLWSMAPTRRVLRAKSVQAAAGPASDKPTRLTYSGHAVKKPASAVHSPCSDDPSTPVFPLQQSNRTR